MVNKIESQIKENKSANRWIVLFLCGIVISWILDDHIRTICIHHGTL